MIRVQVPTNAARHLPASRTSAQSHLGRFGKAELYRSARQFARTHQELVHRARGLPAFPPRTQCAATPYPPWATGKAEHYRSAGQFARTHQELVHRARTLSAFPPRTQCASTPFRRGRPGRPSTIDQRGSSLEPIRNWSTERAACRPSRIAQTTRLCPRRISPAANTPGTLVA